MLPIAEPFRTHLFPPNENSVEGLSDDVFMANATEVRSSKGLPIKRFSDLVKKVAELGYLNPQYNILFRGQSRDYVNSKGMSVIYGETYRSDKRKKRPDNIELQKRFKRLESFVRILRTEQRVNFLESKLLDYNEFSYALLQHYDKCATPLVDLTQSLRVAATFALSNGKRGYVFSFGMPHPHGSISHCVDLQMVLVRLQSVCPPRALRPHYQEGFLAGKFPVKGKNGVGDNLARRMIGKYRVLNDDGSFWDRGFAEVPEPLLFPRNDPFDKELSDLESSVEERVADRTTEPTPFG